MRNKSSPKYPGAETNSCRSVDSCSNTRRILTTNCELRTTNYLTQVSQWPQQGRHILAQYDEDTVVVYQAYRPAIGNFAASRGYFGGEFSLNRMSWIKPNFLWMMYRSGWAGKPGQEVVLAVWLQRSAFEAILAEAVPSQFVPELYNTQEQWQKAVKRSQVRLQWDPDHNPKGGKLARRAIQLGLRGEFLANYARDWIVGIEDISEFVRQQARYVTSGELDRLQTPEEKVYLVNNAQISQRIGLSTVEN